MTPDVSISGIPFTIMDIIDDNFPKENARKKAAMFNVRTKKAEKKYEGISSRKLVTQVMSGHLCK